MSFYTSSYRRHGRSLWVFLPSNNKIPTQIYIFYLYINSTHNRTQTREEPNRAGKLKTPARPFFPSENPHFKDSHPIQNFQYQFHPSVQRSNPHNITENSIKHTFICLRLIEIKWFIKSVEKRFKDRWIQDSGRNGKSVKERKKGHKWEYEEYE